MLDNVVRWVVAVDASDRKALAAVEAEESSSRDGVVRDERVYEVPWYHLLDLAHSMARN